MKKILLSTIAVLAMSGVAIAGPGVIKTDKPVAIIPHDDAPVVYGSFYTVGLKLGTLGLGVDVSMPLSRHFNLRGNINGLSYTKDITNDINNLDQSLKDVFTGTTDGQVSLLTVGLLIDWYPFERSDFFLSAGVYYNANKVGLSTIPTTLKYNGLIVDTTNIDGSITGDILFGNKVAPYIGFGWGNRGDEAGWSWSFEIGGLYQNIPTVSLANPTLKGNTVNVSGVDPITNTTIAGTIPYTSAQLADSITSAETVANDTITNTIVNGNKVTDYLKIYPVISFGITYSF